MLSLNVPSFGASGGLCFQIVVFPGLVYLYFLVRLNAYTQADSSRRFLLVI